MTDKPVRYLDHPAVRDLVKAGPLYQKAALTGLRKPRVDELGTLLRTYVKTATGYRQESEGVITAETILGRNIGVIGQDARGRDIYNEWPIPFKRAQENYGKEVIDGLSSTEFQYHPPRVTPLRCAAGFEYHRRRSKFRATPLTPAIMALLGRTGTELPIVVEGAKAMSAHVGDYLTDNESGQTISESDMDAYQVVG